MPNTPSKSKVKLTKKEKQKRLHPKPIAPIAHEAVAADVKPSQVTPATSTAANKSMMPKRWRRTPKSEDFQTKQSKTAAKLPPAWRIARTALSTLRRGWILFVGIAVINLLMNLLLVRGLTGISDLATLKAVLDSGLGPIAGGLGGVVLLVSSIGGGSTPAASAYQIILGLIVSLAIIWGLREVLAGHQGIRIRDCFYRGMYPLIPVLLVILTICLQLFPLIIGAELYVTFLARGIASTLLEQIFWGVVAALFVAVSLYLLTSSLFATYIAALPDMTPFKALRSARELVRHRRWMVLRKLLFLPLLLIVLTIIVTLPFILYLTPVAPWIFFLLTMAVLPLIHAYMYTLYRELLG